MNNFAKVFNSLMKGEFFFFFLIWVLFVHEQFSANNFRKQYIKNVIKKSICSVDSMIKF